MCFSVNYFFSVIFCFLTDWSMYGHAEFTKNFTILHLLNAEIRGKEKIHKSHEKQNP